jgi:hypothetical protein
MLETKQIEDQERSSVYKADKLPGENHKRCSHFLRPEKDILTRYQIKGL